MSRTAPESALSARALQRKSADGHSFGERLLPRRAISWGATRRQGFRLRREQMILRSWDSRAATPLHLNELLHMTGAFELTRVYSDADGHSHFATVSVDLLDRGTIGMLSEPERVESVIFRENEPSYDYDWHCAPARQFIILLDGEIGLEVSDGERRTFRAGDVLLVEDTSGRGHRTWNVTKAARRSVFITLPPE
jgi:hypothetical protein